MRALKMKQLRLLLLVLLTLSGGVAFAGKAKTYDFNKPAERFKWYQDCREYINDTGGLNCPPGTVLTISKDGKFKTNGDKNCEASVTDKHFLLPTHYTGQSVAFPIKGSKGKPLTAAELDTQIFKLPAAK